MQSPAWLLAELPPLMLIIGSRDMLLGENLAFAQKVQSAGAAAQVEVFSGMWHDFIEETHGCGALDQRQVRLHNLLLCGFLCTHTRTRAHPRTAMLMIVLLTVGRGHDRLGASRRVLYERWRRLPCGLR